MGNLTINELSNSLNDYMDEKQNMEDHSLMTENKTIVGAINEIYGKEIIANAIGEPLNSSETFTEMSNDINSLLSTFKTNMMNSGVTVENSDKFKQLIDKIKGLTEGEGNKGIQYAEGVIDVENIVLGWDEWTTHELTYDIDFEPTILLICISKWGMSSSNKKDCILVICDKFSNSEDNATRFKVPNSTEDSLYCYITNTTSTGCTLNCYLESSTWDNIGGFSYCAIGVGEELSSFEEATFTMFSLNTNSYLSGSAWKNFANYTTTFNGIHTIILKYSIQSSDVNNSTLSSHPVTVEITHADTGKIETLTCPVATSSTQTFTHEFKALVGDNINIKSWGTVLYYTDTTITYTTLIKNK